MAFQGTVWGPTLWNAFFRDCVCAIDGCGFEAVIYADDCNAFRVFSRNMSNNDGYDSLLNCQTSLHAWGHANRVVFDAGRKRP